MFRRKSDVFLSFALLKMRKSGNWKVQLLLALLKNCENRNLSNAESVRIFAIKEKSNLIKKKINLIKKTLKKQNPKIKKEKNTKKITQFLNIREKNKLKR